MRKPAALKYVTRRVNRQGRERYYWQHPDFPLVRLPDEPSQRAQKALELNRKVERGRMRADRGVVRHNDHAPRPGDTLHKQLNRELQRVKGGATDRGLEFALSVEDLYEMHERSGGRCEVSGVEFDTTAHTTTNGSVRRPFAPSVDRINSGQGYTKANTRLVCWAINIALHDWGEDVLWTLVRSMSNR